MPATLLSVELEHPVPNLPVGFDSNDSLVVDSVFADLTTIAARIGVRSLMKFAGQPWHTAVDGLATVRALRAEVARDPSPLLNAQWALKPLAVWEDSLIAAAAVGSRWRVRAELA